MLNRREFIKRSTLLSLAPTVPAFLTRTARATSQGKDDRILVVIQLDGGNDGINTVIPFADEGYAQHRQELRLPKDRLVKLNGEAGLHPSLGDFGKLWDSQRLAIVEGVGYPNPNRSHDVSMAIWQTCRFRVDEQNTYGWLGKALDETAGPSTSGPSAVLIGDETPPVAMRGRKSVATTIDRIEEFQLPTTALSTSVGGNADNSEELFDFVTRSAVDAVTTADKLKALSAGESSSASYPRSELASRLRLTAQLIKANFGTRVFYTVQSGYDTHAAQLPTHARLLRELSRAVLAFLDDLRAAKLDERVAILCFSEFGRRVSENASRGTDHGTAGPVFLAGPAVKPGLHGKRPSLMDLAEGDLKMGIDFRTVYASVLSDWLGVPTDGALGGSYESAQLFTV